MYNPSKCSHILRTYLSKSSGPPPRWVSLSPFKRWGMWREATWPRQLLSQNANSETRVQCSLVSTTDLCLCVSLFWKWEPIQKSTSGYAFLLPLASDAANEDALMSAFTVTPRPCSPPDPPQKPHRPHCHVLDTSDPSPLQPGDAWARSGSVLCFGSKVIQIQEKGLRHPIYMQVQV